MKEILIDQYHQYIKHHGKEPTKLIFNSIHYLCNLESECSEMMFLDRSNKIRRNKFMGMEIIILKDCYGGSFHWGFGE